MKNFIFVFFWILGFSVTAQTLSKESLLEQEKARFQWMIEANKPELEKILHPDLIYNHSSGVSDNQTSYIASIVNKKTVYQSVELEELQARIYGKTGIINGIGIFKNQIDGKDMAPSRLRFTDVWIFEKGQWKMVSWQSTRAPK